MRVEILKSEVEGTIAVPPSKSYTHRALVCSALANGESEILGPLNSDDTEATHQSLKKLGVNISSVGKNWVVEGGKLHGPKSNLFCGESATTLRFMTALCALVDGDSKLTCGPSLSRRPISSLLDSLRLLGVDCASSNGHPPIVVKGKGRIKGGEASIRGDVSSQFISALLLVTPLAMGPVTLNITTPLESKPYVNMTMNTQGRFGVKVHANEKMRRFHIRMQNYKPTEYAIEGDWSSAAYLLAAGGLAGRVTVKGLNRESLQADSAIIDVLRDMGTRIKFHDDLVSIYSSSLRNIDFNVSNCPDLFPVITALCSAAEGTSKLTGIQRLRYKESDRVMEMVKGLRRMGIHVTRESDEVKIFGGTPKGCIIDPMKDHRIAMAFSVLGLVSEGKTTILDAECISKSYPGFWDEIETLGVTMRRNNSE